MRRNLFLYAEIAETPLQRPRPNGKIFEPLGGDGEAETTFGSPLRRIGRGQSPSADATESVFYGEIAETPLQKPHRNGKIFKPLGAPRRSRGRPSARSYGAIGRGQSPSADAAGNSSGSMKN